VIPNARKPTALVPADGEPDQPQGVSRELIERSLSEYTL
jgi:hypothetical protein